MAKEKTKPGRDRKAAGTGSKGRTESATDAAGGQHHAAKAHGQPAQVDTSLPATRPELLALHAAARRRRAAAPLGSEAFRAAVDEIARIEIRVADIERAQDPSPG
ncbi:MAG TPA: hypothetical protein VNM34_09495 [Verrucomicrobiae bacterium]|nr:hypothetical protein [Verrucomicrobiae bacterium]